MYYLFSVRGRFCCIVFCGTARVRQVSLVSHEHKREVSVDQEGRRRTTAHCRAERLAYVVSHSLSVQAQSLYVYVGGGVEYQSEHVTSIVIRCGDEALGKFTQRVLELLGLTCASTQAEMNPTADVSVVTNCLNLAADGSIGSSKRHTATPRRVVDTDSDLDWGE